jgi:hypothetical protein
MKKTLSLLVLLALSNPAFAGKKKKADEAAPPAAAETNDGKKAMPAADAGKGSLKPGQGVGRRVCLGSTSGIGDIEATSNKTVGVATCNGELRRVFLERGICKSHKKNDKVEYGWQFADTTGLDKVTCP